MIFIVHKSDFVYIKRAEHKRRRRGSRRKENEMNCRIPGVHWIGTAILIVFSILLLTGCGGGSSGAGTAGSTVNVSVATAVPNVSPNDPAILTSGLSTSAAVSAADNVDHVWITVHRISLIPGNNDPGPDPNGEIAVQDLSSPDARGHISADLTEPEEIDLLNLPGGTLARFLNAIDNVPAGTYGKIRIYYSDPKVHFIDAPDNTVMHGTANFHLDIHFVGGKLVIPEATGSGVRLFEVTVSFVLGKDGLKITAGPNKILMRPQVFATVSTVRFVLTGVVDNVDKIASAFDLTAGGTRIFHVAYDNVSTVWSFRDPGVPGDPGAPPRAIPIDNQAFAIAALNNGATVDAIGEFTPGGLFLADDITITFPENIKAPVVSGTPSSGWLANDTFVLDLAIDNVVFPKPSRASARYDNNADLSVIDIGQAAIVQGAIVTARGYAVAGGVEAYWISIGP
ncbi:MAG: DUF4382 domain-containing protein [Deltaproteobacteria bacterium]|nr:DUF4382 domain-containing protein [Deltaproteobacteria bacterium]PWB62943.1 MAG: hypothetical protein C3F14_09035 [Deltaproteobacteria bacterium]